MILSTKLNNYQLNLHIHNQLMLEHIFLKPYKTMLVDNMPEIKKKDVEIKQKKKKTGFTFMYFASYSSAFLASINA